ncbi:MAG: DUF86 domain-containing protein [Bacteroidia bacterium]
MQPRPENDLLYLLIILESIGKIEKYSHGFNNSVLFYQHQDQLNFNATLLLLANIGEQTSKVSDQTKEKYPDVQWQKAKDMRNRIVHDYTGIDFDITFEIVKKELPEFKNKIHSIIKTELQTGVFKKEELDVAKASKYYSHVDFNLWM